MSNDDRADAPKPTLPKTFLDAHHHFIDTDLEFMTFLRSEAGALRYPPEKYDSDVRAPLAASGVRLLGSVHVEAMPDDGAAEASWVRSLRSSGRSPSVAALVGSIDLAAPDAAARLAALAASPLVRGVRWILDCVGKYQEGTATHVATKRHDGVDYLRGGPGGGAVPAFEAGYARLAAFGLTFDLQCAPVQLEAAAELAKRHPDVPVVVDHLGKPRTVTGPDEQEDGGVLDEKEIETWRVGMRAMAAVPHVCVKISMLGYIAPGWGRSKRKEAVLRGLVEETIQLFGPERCMVASNWWMDAAASDSDFLSDFGLEAPEFIQRLSEWFAHYSEADRDLLFAGTAKKFYKIEVD